MHTEREVHTTIFSFFGIFNQQLIEEISEIEAMFSEEFVTLHMGDGYSFFNEGGFDIFGIDLFPEHLGENFDLFLSPYNESTR